MTKKKEKKKKIQEPHAFTSLITLEAITQQRRALSVKITSEVLWENSTAFGPENSTTNTFLFN